MAINPIPWSQAGWLSEAGDWIHDSLQARGIRVAGELDPFYTRPWSNVIRVPADIGNVYFKATSPAIRHEVAITAALNQWQPECTLPVLAMDIERGWLLLPDGGTRLREVIRESRAFQHWESVLTRYAELQIEMLGRVQAMLSMNMPDRRLTALPALFASLLEDASTLRIDQPDGLTPEEYRRLVGMAPRLAAMCEQLGSYGIPDTLNHGDLTDGNVFVAEGQTRIFDWGDCAVSHPFYSLRTTFVSLYFSLGIDDGSPELSRLRDVYLDAWTAFAPREVLLKAFHLSQVLAAVNGALGWHRIMSTLSEADRAEYARPVPALLQEFLQLAESQR